MFEQLVAWLDRGSSTGTHTVNEACKALDNAGLQHGLVACIKRAAAPGNCCSPMELSMGVQAARCTGLAIRNSSLSPSFIASFSNAGCVPALCDLIERWPDNEEMLRTAIFALRHIVEDEAAAIEALFIGAARVIIATAKRLPGLVDLQTNSEQAIQLMSLHREEWIKRKQEEQQRSRSSSPTSRLKSARRPEPTSPFQMQAPNLFSFALPSAPMSFRGLGVAPMPCSPQFAVSPAPPLVPIGPDILSHRGLPWR